MNFSLTSRLKLVPIRIRKDKKHYIVEDINSGEFYEMPRICIDAIHLMNDSVSLKEIEQQLIEKYPGEEVDILDFANQLVELQLLAMIDGVETENLQLKKEQPRFLWIPSKVGKFFFNKLSIFMYITLFLVNIALFICYPFLLPHYMDLFIFNLMALNIPVWIIVSVILLLLHEIGHVLAMRAYDMPTRLSLGHRLFLIVFETDMTSIWKLTSKERNVLYLAGLCFDTLLLFFALIIQLVLSHGPQIILSIFKVMVLDIFIRMVYQCCIYMKTDLYFVFENTTGCYNLMENAQQIIRGWVTFRKVLKRDDLFNGESKIVHIYAVFYFIGVVLTIFLYVWFYLPQLFFSIKKVVPILGEGQDSQSFWDSIIFLLQIAIGFCLLFYSWRKKYFQKS